MATSLCVSGPAWSQRPAAQIQPPEVEVEEVVVTGHRGTEQVAREFVAEIGAAPDGRELAIWRDPICVGVLGMRAEAASILADRVSDWGHSLDLRISDPGCEPNILIVATNDARAMANDLVNTRPRDFHTGSTGTDRGRRPLSAFRNSDLLVRWWHVSLPVDEGSGRPTVRLWGAPPLEIPKGPTQPSQFGWAGRPVLASRLINQDQDDLQQVVIVLDVAAFDQAEFAAVADYLSMVALAQIDADAAPDVPSILNLFNGRGGGATALTQWDQSYLRALYETRISGPRRNVNAIATATAQQVRSEPQAQPTP